MQESPGPVWLEVDLGEARLVSGIQSQGPPLPLHNAAYMRYIRCSGHSQHCSTFPLCSLSVSLSLDSRLWTDCCSEDGSRWRNAA